MRSAIVSFFALVLLRLLLLFDLTHEWSQNVIPRNVSARANFTLFPGDKQRLSLQRGKNYTFLVNATAAFLSHQSGFVFQLHTQKHSIILTNNTQECTNRLECQTMGRDVGLVQLWTSDASVFPFFVSVSCGGNCLHENVSVLAAVVRIPRGDPIPGGCTLTSYLEIDAGLTLNYSTYSTTVKFQDSDIGYSPPDRTVPICDDENKNVMKLEYRVYHRCLGVWNFDTGAMFDAIEDMLTPHVTQHDDEYLYTSLDAGSVKRVLFDSKQGQGVVYNVLAIDKNTDAASTYIPASTYACDFESDVNSCHQKIDALSAIAGVVLMLSGLFVCFLGHRFFHAEVFVLSAIIFFYIWYLTLVTTTDWSYTANVGGSFGLALGVSALLFIFWFFLGWYYPFVIIFGLAMGFLLTATLLYTPFGSFWSVLQISYVYILLVLAGTVFFMVFFIAFPAALNIWCCVVIGSYTVIFGIGMFRYTALSEIVLKMVKNASIPGFLSAKIVCPLQTMDIILACLWIVLLVGGLVTQIILWRIKKKKFQRQQQMQSTFPRARERFTSFPKSLYQLLRQYLRNRRLKMAAIHSSIQEQEPLLSPNSILARRPS